MTWQKPHGEEHDFIDGRTHEHHIRFVNAATGGEHHVVIRLGVDACPHCRRPFAKNDLGQIDPKQVVEEQLKMLNDNHAALMEYAEKHGVPIRVGELHSQVPDGRKLITRGVHRLLVAARSLGR